jgi:glyoxylase-like metal-dependent hydrolase (beta-lactamase superfamily II)
MRNVSRTTNPRVMNAGNDTFLIDLYHQGEPRTIGAYLLLDECPSLIETGPANSLEHLVAGVHEAGLDPLDLRYVFVTHIHLDHAGATGALLEQYPHLKVFVHPLGAPHLTHPEKLWRSATRVFGESLHTLFGEPVPVPEDRVQVLKDDAVVSLGRRQLKAIATPGHASHHFALWEESSGWLFGGDVAGCDLPDGYYVHPPTPSPEVDLEAWRQSIARMRSLKPTRLLYSHFGWTDQPDEALLQLQDELERRAELVRAWLSEGLDEEEIKARFVAEVDDQYAAKVGPVLAPRYRLLGDGVINATGLIRYWRKRLAEQAS